MTRNAHQPHLSRRALRGVSTLLVVALLAIAGNFGFCTPLQTLVGMVGGSDSQGTASGSSDLSLTDIPAYDGEPTVLIGADSENPDGAPAFTTREIERAEKGTFEDYSELDALGRCGVALACLGEETMPTSGRGDISEIHPSGWHQRFYDFVDRQALYNRSHLIAHSLSGEDANERNLITGTRTMNNEGMRPWEERTVSYIRRTGNHVLYRATPVFEGDELVSRGVRLEARSVEDDGLGLSFDVYCYNVEPGVQIDYRTGDSWEE